MKSKAETQVEKTKQLYENLFRELSKEIHSCNIGLSFEKGILQLHLEQLEFQFRPGVKCIDVGSGSGRYSAALKMLYPSIQIFSLEIGLENILQHRAEAMSINADALQIPFKDNTFDFVMCLGVIQHTINPRKAVAELLRVCKPDGAILLYTYGKGLYNYFIESLRCIARLIGNREAVSSFAFHIAKKLHFNSRVPLLMLDELYVDIRHTFSRGDVEEMIYGAGKPLRRVEFIKHPKEICNINDLQIDAISKALYKLIPKILLIEAVVYL